MIHIQGDSLLASVGVSIPTTTGGLDFADPAVVRLVGTTRFGNIATPVNATDAANKDYVDHLSRPFVVSSVIVGRPQKLGTVTVPFGVTLSATREINGSLNPFISLTHPRRESLPTGAHRPARDSMS